MTSLICIVECSDRNVINYIIFYQYFVHLYFNFTESKYDFKYLILLHYLLGISNVSVLAGNTEKILLIIFFNNRKYLLKNEYNNSFETLKQNFSISK